MKPTKEIILEKLSQVLYPEFGKDIVTLQMVESIVIENDKIILTLHLPPNSPFKTAIERACHQAISSIAGKDIGVEMVFTSKEIHTKPVQKEVLPRVKNIIAIASGKGGVGKSTVAVNLAVALAMKNFKVGLIDADIFGPSIPKMFQLEGEKPFVKKILGKDFIIPLEKYGVKVLSIGFFIEPESAVVWRGPMATGALQQFINDTDWGPLDYLLIDLPPGTSDIHLTLVQTVPVTGAIIVSTPQQVALADAVKGINMFLNDKINVPVLGIVENMAWFTPAELPQNKYYIFGKDGCRKLAERFNLPVLGQIPIVQGICESGDSGVPSALSTDSEIGKAFADLSEKVIGQINYRKQVLAPTKVVETTNAEGCSH